MLTIMAAVLAMQATIPRAPPLPADAPAGVALPPRIYLAPPPSMRTTVMPIDADIAVSDVDVVLRGPSGPLWQGRLRVADRGGETTWSQIRSEPAPAACPSRPGYWMGERESLSIGLSMLSRNRPSELMVQVKWVRRSDTACDGLRTVELRQAVPLRDRETIVLNGDGGLRVELRWTAPR